MINKTITATKKQIASNHLIMTKTKLLLAGYTEAQTVVVNVGSMAKNAKTKTFPIKVDEFRKDYAGAIILCGLVGGLKVFEVPEPFLTGLRKDGRIKKFNLKVRRTNEGIELLSRPSSLVRIKI